ncbi:hypothetical protein SDRG_11808 [Saprolegnia diclina VS20]|uniref:Uncharacterized protein n=1 Tax=Saprolegnia diclina (strain VS20) TaxID=1156394 RepID=T0RKT5_SAPDV|nr:hypothetical protein SDRG_11808 [Saprolegnia diclina VS20]EQC30492.1 hypothetical protein SDRG_11808 [Saprolegnia diclina VS20]|eukprot:XP_008616085.1 hypothetical protein SDRG_11808 [Saprolegnia diclina VS20]
MVAGACSTKATTGADPVKRINQAIETLDWPAAQAALDVIGNDGFEVCSATEADWDSYVESADQRVNPRFLEYRNNAIYLIEMGGGLHGDIVAGISEAMLVATSPEATGTNARVLRLYHETHINKSSRRAIGGLPKLEPDCCCGPASHIGAIKPAHLRWNEFHTFKVEVGVSQGWRSMDVKVARYCAFPGIRYVLCVIVSPDMSVREYKLFAITNDELEGPAPDLVPPTPITAATRIVLDGRRLLALPNNTALPGRFPAEVSFTLQPILDAASIHDTE